MDIYKTGERLVISFDYSESPVEATVIMASSNGRSLMLGFEAMFGGYVGMMPVLWSVERDEFVDLMQARPVKIRRAIVSPGV